jgi:Zn-dependent peptidase ImmA (M78 family)
MKNFVLFILMCFSFHSYSLEETTIHIESALNYQKSWMEYSSSEEINLKKLLELLSRSSTGEKLINEARYKAARTGLLLEDVIKVGESSLTDTTLVRKFSPHSPEHVIYETRSVVYISRNLHWDDALLDLAHELTHYVYRGGFNPYSDSFNPSDFIKSTIEGPGGEVQAFLMECLVLRELFTRKVQMRSNCQRVEDLNGVLSKTKAIELFYYLGSYYDEFYKQLEKRKIASDFPNLKADKINFISSAYGVPYPIAALMEFDLVINKVCENDKKRLAYMQQGPKREPSSFSEGQTKFIQTHKARCERK